HGTGWAVRPAGQGARFRGWASPPPPWPDPAPSWTRDTPARVLAAGVYSPASMATRRPAWAAGGEVDPAQPRNLNVAGPPGKPAGHGAGAGTGPGGVDPVAGP